ncbi:hypothetical protein CDAR_550161 [Caerostris darwini]|uniref:Uncharacterized protein n=1 Tax=Caerostris darwini TaxID=1538125 RepID=A0AAV4PI04_9ARAC|nr:hypothetical protein CDAR_550161 [Caerostris darwini]
MKNVARPILSDFEPKSSLFNKTKLSDSVEHKIPDIPLAKEFGPSACTQLIVRCSISVRTENAQIYIDISFFGINRRVSSKYRTLIPGRDGCAFNEVEGSKKDYGCRMFFFL